MSRKAIENAVRNAVLLALGLPNEKVLWARQKTSRPTRPFVTLLLSGPTRLGTGDAREQSVDLSQAGQEVTIRRGGPRALTCSVQAFSASVIGDDTAVALLSRLQTALSRDDVRGALLAGGVAVYDEGSVEDLEALLDTEFEGRAALDLSLYAGDSTEEHSTYIARAEVENVSSGEVLVVESE
jgi:hypothetical protein